MTAPVVVSGVSLLIVLITMLLELRLSRRNERALRRRGASEPPDPVFPLMRVAYPAVFVAMAVEGALSGRAPGAVTVAGAVLLVIAKSLKFWAIGTLGSRWTFRVLVLPGEPLVTRGPYAIMRHPNYVAVVGELIGMALLTAALATGVLSIALFGWLLWRRISAEEQALQLR